MKRYTKKELGKLADRGIASLQKGMATDVDKWLIVAAAHTMDLCRISEDLGKGKALGLSVDTSDSLNEAISLSHLHLLSQGKRANESRDTLSKQLGSYMFFSTNNDIQLLGLETDTKLGSSKMELGVTTKDGSTYSFDFLKNARFTLSKYQLSDLGEPPMVFGDINPIYRRLYEELMIHIL